MRIERILLIVAFWIGFAVPASAQTKLQDCATVVLTAGANQAACTLGSAVVVNNMLAACVHTGAGGVPTVVDSQGDPVLMVPGTVDGVFIYYAQHVHAGTHTWTATTAASGIFLGINFAEFGGMGAAPSPDGNFAVGTYATGRTVIQTTTLTTSGRPNELLFGCGITDSVQTPSALIDYGGGGGTPTALTNQGQSATSGGDTQVGAYQVVSAAGPYGFQWAVTSSGTIGAIAAFFPTQAITTQAIAPNGPGGICEYAATALGTLTLYGVPVGTLCTSLAQNVGACPAGGAPSGSGTVQCAVCCNGAGCSWVGC